MNTTIKNIRVYRYYSCFRAIFLLAAFLFVSSVGTLAVFGQEEAGVDAEKSSKRYDKIIIEYISIDPKVKVSEVGDTPVRGEGDDGVEEVTVTVHLRNLSDKQAYIDVEYGRKYGNKEVGYISPDESIAVERKFKVNEVPWGTRIDVSTYDMAVHELVKEDSAYLHKADAMRVALVVEQKTFNAGEKEFGSFVRKMRASFYELHKQFEEASTDMQNGLIRKPILDRFRIDHVEVYDGATVDIDNGKYPPLFADHGEYDLVIVCDEGGPLAGFWLPQYSIGHNFMSTKDGVTHGLWSAWGEAALWHEMLHFRGVQDYYIYTIPAGAVSHWTDTEISLPELWQSEIMNSPYKEFSISALTAAIVNSKKGVARVGACEDIDNEYGHMWKWVPKSITVKLTDGSTPIQKAMVSWWRSLPVTGLKDVSDSRFNGVAVDRVNNPDGKGISNSAGEFVIDGGYLGQSESEFTKRSLWVLYEVTHPGSGEKRFGIIYGLWLNTVYAAGNTDEATLEVNWSDLQVVKK